MAKNIYFRHNPKANQMKKYLIQLVCVLFFGVVFLPAAKSQVFYIGFQAGPTYSWYTSPPSDIVLSSKGWGHNIGFFLRYGKRPFYQIGFDWTRDDNDFSAEFPEFGVKLEDKVPFHNFDFSVKVGYELIQTPYFKWSVFAGPFIGRSLLFKTNDFDFEKTDFINPQYGLITGTGFQITNFIISFDYNLHLSGLFTPVEVDGFDVDFSGKLQIVSIKVGMQF
jgi:hypothetical protein